MTTSRTDVNDQPRLLLAEDDSALRRSLIRTLREIFQVVPVADGAEAARFLMNETFDGVLSDIGLPGMSGVELLRLVRTYRLDVPVVLMTGQPSIETAVDAVELGAVTYLRKPFAQSVLRETMIRTAKMARARREAARARTTTHPLANDGLAADAMLDRAIEGLSMVYQPIVDSRSRCTIGYEALLRTRERGIPHAGALLELAERLERLYEVGRRARELAATSFRPPRDGALLFVNLHPADLLDPSLYDDRAPLSKMADHVVLEITEGAALSDLADTSARVLELRRRGYRLAIDDLGAGYAGLKSFALLEPEIVKLDMSLIRSLERSPIKRHVVDSMTRLCRDLDMKVVAEGIETRPELACVLDIGCDYLQGYFLGRPAPVPVDSLTRW